jgi:hypothetical protein
MPKWEEDEDSPQYVLQWERGGEPGEQAYLSIGELTDAIEGCLAYGAIVESVRMIKTYRLTSPIGIRL